MSTDDADNNDPLDLQSHDEIEADSGAEADSSGAWARNTYL